MGKVTRTYAFTVTVDPEAYAREYGYSVASAEREAWESMQSIMLALEEAVQGGWFETVSAVVAVDPLQAMGESTRRELLSAFDSWAADRDVLGHREETDGGMVDYASSDDTAVDLLRQVAAALRTTDECGHGDSDVDGDTVTCAWCGQTWTVGD